MKRNLLLNEIQSLIKITTVFLFLLIGAVYQLSGQSTYTWQGANNASWATGTNWNPTRTTPTTTDILQFNTGTTLTITAVPTQTIGRLIISNNTNITLQGSSSNRTLTIGNGTGTDLDIPLNTSMALGTNLNMTLATSATANINGTFTINANRTFNTNGTTVVTTVNGSIINLGTVTCTTASKLLFQNSSIYQHNRNGGSIPIATWDANSNCNITGVTSTTPTATSFNQSFENFTWNCTTQSGAIDFNGNLRIINGDFTVLSTNNQQLRLSSGETQTLNVTGNFTMSAGTLNFNSSSGTFTMNVAGNFNHSGGTITETSSGIGSIFFNGTYNGTTGMQTYTSGGTVVNTINFTVSNGAYLQMAATGTSITGGGTFTLSNGATLGITSADGITATVCGIGATCGNIRTTTRTFNTGANYIYNGSAAQNTGNGLPPSVSNLIFDNSGGVITFNSAIEITNNFDITSGSEVNLDSYSHTASYLTLGGEGTTSGSWGSTSSSATNQNDDYFSPTSGIINVTNSNCGVIAFPTGISASPSVVCSGSSVTLSVNNPGAGLTTDWFTGSCGGIVAGSGNTISVTPNTTTIYYARTRNTTTGCVSACVNVTVTVVASVADFDANVIDATCMSSNDGSIEITNPIPIQFNDPDYIEIGSNLLSNRNAFTLEGWIKVDLNDIGTRISLFGQNDAIEFGFMSSTSLMCWTASGGSVSADNIYPSDNSWHHVAAVGNGTNIILYIDGVQVATGGNVIGNYGNNTSFSSKIGAGVWDPTGGYFPGQMLKIGFWNTALNATQISNLAADYFQYTGSETGLMAGYNFFEGTGTILSSEITGTDGNFNGTPTWTDINTYSWTKTGEPGFSAASKNISALTTGEYNLTVSNGSCNRAKSFTVNSTLPAFTSGAILSTGETICNGGDPILIGSSTASSGGDNSITYEWRANGTPISGTNSAPYDPPAGLTTTTTYTRWAKDGACNTTFTQSTGSWVVTVNPLPVITTQPVDLTICEGESGSFTVVTSASSPTYQWGYATSPTPASWIDVPEGGDISGTETNVLDIANILLGYNGVYVSCLITANGCESRSSAVEITVNPLPTTGEIIPD